MKRHIATTTALVALAATGCYGAGATTPCTPTVTKARRADKVNVGSPARSSVIEATLTANGKPLSGRSLTFEVLDEGAAVYADRGSTGGNGTARVDLKRVDPDALTAVLRADAFQAAFAGDGTYCSSSGQEAFHAVAAGSLPVDPTRSLPTVGITSAP